MITADRLQGIVVFGFGCVLLWWLVPNHVTAVPGDPLDPSLFPRIAGWLILVLGLFQIATAKPGAAVPPLAEVAGFAGFIAALVVAALLLPRLGFLPVAGGLMVVSIVLLRENRPLWAALTLAGVPLFVWLLFAVLLSRPLS